MGVGEGSGEDRVEQAVERAISGRLLDTRIGYKKHEAEGLLIHVSGGEDMTLHEVYHAGELVKRVIPEDTRVIWGTRVDKELEGKCSVMVVLTGVQSTNLGSTRKPFGPFKISNRKYLPW